jgi:SEC-C motif
MPHREPLRNVGRNDPCPCGSGKKFKKCCLNRASDHPAADDPPWEPVGSRRRAS